MEQSLPFERPISALTTPHFYREEEALSLLKALRWPDGVTCPRCGASDVREVQTSRVLEAMSCRECRYNFTTVADSYFHGSRIPLSEHLQFLVAIALEPDASALRLARFFGWRPTTIGRQLARLGGLREGDFVHRVESYRSFEEFASPIEYLAQPAVTIFPNAFNDRIRKLLTPRGRALRRSSKSKAKQKVKPEAVILEKFSAPPRRLPLVSPSSLPYLADDAAAYDLIDSLRWENKKRACPRCGSRFVLPIKRDKLRELHRCVDCHYMFNSLAGTIFQGTRMPIQKFFQFFIVYNALGDKIRMQDICYVLDCTFRTAALWKERGRAFMTPEKFAFMDPRAAARLQADDTKQEDKEPFFSFCAMKGIVVHEAHLLEYMKGVCRTPVNG